MKKLTFLFLLSSSVLLLTYCNSTKKAQAAKPTKMIKLTYEANVKMLVATKCAPCHTQEKGRLPAYITYAAVTKDIDDIIRRVHLNPGERGFMPMKNPKLSDSAIHVFEQWKADGLVEK